MKQTYIGLDLIRFGAAALVMMFHLSFLAWLKTPGFSQQLHPIGVFFTAGWVGVPIFFVLSGFVIAFSASGKTHVEFAKGRILRLYPAAWLCASLTLLAVWGQADVAGRYLRSITLSPVGPWIDAVYWTLGIEIVFYVVVWLQMTMFGARRLVETGMLVGLASVAYWAARMVDLATGRRFEDVFVWFDTPLGHLTLLACGAEFGLGILLWSMTRDGITVRKAIVAILCLGGALAWTGAIAHSKSMDGLGPKVDIVVAPAILLAAVILIAAAAFWNDGVQRYLGRWSQAFRTVGLATYPLYLLHEEIGLRVMALFRPADAVLGLCCAVAVVAGCVGLVLVVEPRVRRVLASVLDARTARPSVAQLP